MSFCWFCAMPSKPWHTYYICSIQQSNDLSDSLQHFESVTIIRIRQNRGLSFRFALGWCQSCTRKQGTAAAARLPCKNTNFSIFAWNYYNTSSNSTSKTKVCCEEESLAFQHLLRYSPGPMGYVLYFHLAPDISCRASPNLNYSELTPNHHGVCHAGIGTVEQGAVYQRACSGIYLVGRFRFLRLPGTFSFTDNLHW